MRQTRYQKEELRLEAEKRVKYKGTARIKLEWLHFRWNEPRELDSKNVERLKSNFRRDCRRLDIHNHIPALINQQDLNAATQASEVSAQSLLSNPQGGYPELNFPTGYQLECLHGRHRIQAAKEVLPCGDKWWTVDLYLADVNSQLKTCLIEEYSNEEKPADGEIYRKIRQYHFQRNLSFERRWWTRLTPHGSKNLKQLFRHDELTAAFDALLDIPGLWGGMRISTLHKMMAIRCEEEILCYLDHIREVWFTLLGHDKNAMRKVDQATVKSVELQAPWASTLDAKTLRGQVLGGEIFDRFNEQDRVQIWSRLQAVDGLIPSLFTLFEDVKYLEICADCVKQLVSLSPRDTVSTALQRAFSGATQRADQAIVQVAESSFASRPAGSADRVDLSCRQLYAYAMRHYLDMPKESNGNDLLARLTIKADKTVLRGFADLADRLGFESPKITALKRYPRSTAAIISPSQSNPLLITDGPGELRKRRCGLPRKENYENDSRFLFLDNLHDDKKEQADGITSFFIRKSVYLQFHGRAGPAAVISTTGGSSLPHYSTIDMITHPDPPTYRQLDCDGPQAEYDYMEEGTDRTQGENEQGRLEREKEQERLVGLEQERLVILEQARLEQARLEQARLEQERREQERREQARLEQARLEQARLEQARLEQERLKQERQEQERLARLEQERLARLEQVRQEQEWLEQARLEQARLEQARLEQERLEQERQEQERLAGLEQERLEQERLEQERLEQEILEQERLARLEQVRQEQERLEQEKLEQERQEQERLARLEQEILEQERLARLEQVRQEQEWLEQARLEQARLEQARLEQERLEQERQEQERQEQERQEQERLAGLEQERLEQERLEQERLAILEQARLEQERQEQVRLEQERREQARWEQERREQERLEQEKLAILVQERLEQEKLKQERREQERLARLKEEKLEQERQDQEKKEQEKLEQERLEQERQEEERQEDEPDRQEQQRLGQENLFEEEIARQEDLFQAGGDGDQSTSRVRADKLSAEKARARITQIDLEKAMGDSPYRNGLPTSTSDHIKLKTNISVPTSQPDQRSKENSVVPTATITEERLKITKVCIKFKAREKGVWKDTSVLEIDPFDPSEVERVAKEMVRNGMRLFDTELRLLAPQECYQEVVIDGTNTILLIPNAEMDINDEIMASASNVRVDALSNQERLLKRVATDNISQLYHIRKKQNGRVLK